MITPDEARKMLTEMDFGDPYYIWPDRRLPTTGYIVPNIERLTVTNKDFTEMLNKIDSLDACYTWWAARLNEIWARVSSAYPYLLLLARGIGHPSTLTVQISTASRYLTIDRALYMSRYHGGWGCVNLRTKVLIDTGKP